MRCHTENAAPAATRRPITSYDESNQLNIEEQPDQTDNGLSVEEEWNLLSTEVPDEKNVDDDDGDGDGDDNVIDANLLVGAQCAVVFEVEDSFAKWRGKGGTSNLRDEWIPTWPHKCCA